MGETPTFYSALSAGFDGLSVRHRLSQYSSVAEACPANARTPGSQAPKPLQSRNDLRPSWQFNGQFRPAVSVIQRSGGVSLLAGYLAGKFPNSADQALAGNTGEPHPRLGLTPFRPRTRDRRRRVGPPRASLPNRRPGHKDGRTISLQDRGSLGQDPALNAISETLRRPAVRVSCTNTSIVERT